MSKKAGRDLFPGPTLNKLPSLTITTAFQRALMLLRQGQLDESETLLREILKEEPKLFDARHFLGLIELQRKNFKAAAHFIGQALKLDPKSAQAHVNLGNALRGLGRHEEAVRSYDRALAIQPELAVAFFNRGDTLFEIGRHDQARVSFDGALKVDPGFAQARFARCMAELPIIYVDDAEVIERRAEYENCLTELCRAGAELASGVGVRQPFYLAYQGRNDRDLQALYGSFVCRIVSERHPPASLPAPPSASDRVRIGIVSGFFRNHANWRLPIKGWLAQLDRRQFHIFGYYTGTEEDSETRVARDLCDRFVRGPLSLEKWRAQILADAPHVLIYPEVGMDPLVTWLAAQRLASVQCNSWGHPETSGFSTLDYFLGSDLMEPPNAQDHYTEKLVRLPNLSVYFEPVDRPATASARRDFGLRESAVIYWCGQSLYKFLPRHDGVFPQIARAAGDCQFVFIQYRTGRHVTETFRQRLNRSFAAEGLRAAEHCVFLPRLSQDEFIAATGLGDVYLDSLGWSGCNSTIESLFYDMPIVTMPGGLMRSRHSAAMLEMMGVGDTIAATIDDYIAIAARLARDKSWRMAVKTKISSNKHLIYHDRAPVLALENFLNRVARQQSE